jgi:hypothetical protein
MSLCSVAFPDVRHTVSVTVRPPEAGDRTMGVAQRLEMLREANITGNDQFESAIFGEVGCYRVEENLGQDELLPVATCFEITGGYIAVSVAADDPKLVSFDVVRGLLTKAAGKRE